MIPRRKVEQRGTLHSGARRWLVGANTQWQYEKGNSTHGAIARWRYLFEHVYSYEDWVTFQEKFWDQWRNTILQWHRERGWKLPPPHLRGHRAERDWLWNQRRSYPRGKRRVGVF
jgi:hypothetical protein